MTYPELAIEKTKQTVPAKKWLRKMYDAGHVSLIIVIICALYIRIAVFEPFMVPSGSMKPTLIEGDYIVVYKYPYGISKYSIPFTPINFDGRYFVSKKPQAGDIVVFKNPNMDSMYYVKRLIGLPGDKVQVLAGNLFINGQKLKKTPEGTYSDRHDHHIAKVEREYMREDSNYLTLDIMDTDADNTKEFIVPANHYFFMGDNRDNSTDSREGLGFVHEDYIIGKAEYIIFSEDYLAFPSWDLIKLITDFRADRFLKNLY